MFYKQKNNFCFPPSPLCVSDVATARSLLIKTVFFKWSLVQSCSGWEANHMLTVETPSQLQSSQTKAETTVRLCLGSTQTSFMPTENAVKGPWCFAAAVRYRQCRPLGGETLSAGRRAWRQKLAARWHSAQRLMSVRLLCYIWLRTTRPLSFMFYRLRAPRVDMALCEDLQPPFLSAAIMFDSESL